MYANEGYLIVVDPPPPPRDSTDTPLIQNLGNYPGPTLGPLGSPEIKSNQIFFMDD